MSRRSLPPGGPWRQGPSSVPRSTAAFASQAVDVLSREAAIGSVLWGCRSANAWLDVGSGLVCLGLVIFLSRWIGMLRPRGWAAACKEGIILFIGSSCLANVLLFIFGLAPWFAIGPK